MSKNELAMQSNVDEIKQLSFHEQHKKFRNTSYATSSVPLNVYVLYPS